MAKEKKGEGPMDKDTKEILEEMEAEGIDTASLTGGETVVERHEETEPEEEETPASEDEGEKSETEDPDLEESAEETEEEESDGEANDSEDDEEGDEDGGKSKRVPLVQKYRNLKKTYKETLKTLESLQNAKSEEAFDKELSDFAKEAGMNLDVAKKFVEIAAKKAQLSPDLIADLKKSQIERRDKEYWNKQHKMFDQDFKSNVQPVLENLGLDEARIHEIYTTLNDKTDLSESSAWHPKNKSTSLVKLALSLQRTSGNRTSSEGGHSKSLNRGKAGKALEDLTAEDWENMPDEEFDKASDALGKSSKSSFHRS